MNYNLGRVLPIFKGEYDNDEIYTNLDVVYYNGSSYVAKEETQGNLPTDTEYWQPIAMAGVLDPEQIADIEQQVIEYVQWQGYVIDPNYTHTDNNYTNADKTKLDGIDMSTKQDTLVSGTNIKTINNENILGSGNISIEGGSGTSDYTQLTNKPSVNGTTLEGNVNLATPEQLNAKQDTLVSGTNIKTINGNNLLGSGDLSIDGADDRIDNYVAVENIQSIAESYINGTTSIITAYTSTGSKPNTVYFPVQAGDIIRITTNYTGEHSNGTNMRWGVCAELPVIDSTVDNVEGTDGSVLYIDSLYTCQQDGYFCASSFMNLSWKNMIITKKEKINKPQITYTKQYKLFRGAKSLDGPGIVENSPRITSCPIYFSSWVGMKTIKVVHPNTLKVYNSVQGSSYYYNTVWGYNNLTPVRKVYFQIVPSESETETTLYVYNDGTFNSVEVQLANKSNTSTRVTDAELNATYCETVGDYKLSDYEGKVMVSLGDSITWGFIPRNSPNASQQQKSYARLVAEKLGCGFFNYGISGSSVAELSGRQPMYIRYADMQDCADIITFMGGTNDVRNGVQLGTMSDRVGTTYYGALHILMQGLYTKYITANTEYGKNKKILILTPIKLLDPAKSSLANTVENNADVLIDWGSWIEAVKEVAAFYSFNVVDMYNESGINPHLDRTLHGTYTGYTGYYNPYITDGTHPTQEGAVMMANLLESKM